MMSIFFGFLVLAILVFMALVYFFKKITTENTETNLRRISAVYEDLVKKQKDLAEKITVSEKELQMKKEEAATVVDKLSAQAMDEVRKKEDDVLKKARAEAEEILSKAHASRDQFYHELKVEVSQKVIDYTQEMLQFVFDQKILVLIHDELIRKFISQGEKSDIASIDLRGQKLIVKTAIPLSEEQKEKLRKFLSEKVNSPSLEFEEVVDEKLIAGVALQVGTLMMDGSFVSLLKEASNKTKEKLQD